jgi:hypothetical protein
MDPIEHAARATERAANDLPMAQATSGMPSRQRATRWVRVGVELMQRNAETLQYALPCENIQRVSPAKCGSNNAAAGGSKAP